MQLAESGIIAAAESPHSALLYAGYVTGYPLSGEYDGILLFRKLDP